MLRERARPWDAATRCELCGTKLAIEHAHVLDLSTRMLSCSCRACAALFDDTGTSRYRTVPRRVLFEEPFPIGSEERHALEGAPEVLGVFYDSSAAAWVALCPGRSGAVERPLERTLCDAVLEKSRLGPMLNPDVEALLVRARDDDSSRAWIVPIDVGYAVIDACTRDTPSLDGLFRDLEARGRALPAWSLHGGPSGF
nr:MAG: hypothetical protein DIU78_02665 [Pseudomonadota bacterium]